jgi:hypothetical protein
MRLVEALDPHLKGIALTDDAVKFKAMLQIAERWTMR